MILDNVSSTFPALLSLGIFILAYGLVILEEFTKLRKSKPVVLAAGLMWILVAWIAYQKHIPLFAEQAVKAQILNYAELLLFLIVAMTYINALEDHQVFEAIRGFLLQKQLSFRGIFWITGFLAFFISPFADNLTTALSMSAVILAIGKNHPQFVGLSCINIVVAANAGGAFSPFGDITTLMVWQAGLVPFEDFFKLFFPALVNFLLPALCMHFFISNTKPKALEEKIVLLKGAKTIIILFFATILTTVLLHHLFHLPPVFGMMCGLGYLQLYAYFTKFNRKQEDFFDIFPVFQKVEWDTLLFFYGIMLCVGALGALGYLIKISNFLYIPWSSQMDPFLQTTLANSFIGILSALIDNIPVMFAIISMDPHMSTGQWLLVTLTTGVGGSLLSIGSAAGIALMGQAKNSYHFLTHLKWTPVIFLGFVASILCHLWLNAKIF